MKKNFIILEQIPTKKFSINGIVYNKEDVYEQRFTRVIAEGGLYGKLHVRWNKPQKAFVDDYGNSVNSNKEVQARECLCSGFLFESSDLKFIED